MSLSSLKELYIEELQDLYSAETQLLNALPKMEQNANSERLRTAFATHLEETRGHVGRLEQIFRRHGLTPGGHTCEAMQGIISEGEKMMRKQGDPDVKDAAMIAAAQRVEHYEIAGYGTVRAYAKLLEYDEDYNLLDDTLQEEGKTDHLLTGIAEGGLFMTGINEEANVDRR